MHRFLPIALTLAFFAVAGSAQAKRTDLKWTTPTNLTIGVEFSQCTIESPRLVRISAIHIDFKRAKIGFTGTGRTTGWGQPLEDDGTGLLNPSTKEPYDKELTKIRVKGETVTDFFTRMDAAEDHEALIAFPSRGMRNPRFKSQFFDPWGLYISNGVVVSDGRINRRPIFVIRKDGTASIEEAIMPAEYPDILLAHSGNYLIRKNGNNVTDPNLLGYCARIAIGLSADKQHCYIVSYDSGTAAYEKDTRSSYHDLNDIFEILGASDAMGFDGMRSTALVIRDPEKGGPRQLNLLKPSTNDTATVETVIGVYKAAKGKTIAASQPAADDDKSSDQVTAHLAQKSVSVLSPTLYKIRKTSYTSLRGQIRVNLSTSQPRIRRPIAHVIGLFDVGGTWKCYDTVLTEQKTSEGPVLAGGQTAARLSQAQMEVTASDWRQPVYGDAKNGFFKKSRIDEKAKLLCYRIEIWQNGTLVDSYEYMPKSTKRLGVPDSWHIKGKHLTSMTYTWPPPPPPK